MSEDGYRRGSPTSPKQARDPHVAPPRGSTLTMAREPRAPPLVTGSRPAPAYPLLHTGSVARSSMPFSGVGPSHSLPQYPPPSSHSSSSAASVASGSRPASTYSLGLNTSAPPSNPTTPVRPSRRGPSPTTVQHMVTSPQRPGHMPGSAGGSNAGSPHRPGPAVPPQYPFQVALSETSRALEKRIMQPGTRLSIAETPHVHPDGRNSDTRALPGEYFERQSSPRRPESRSRELVPANVHQDLVHANMYLQPELEKERRLRISEQMRADRAERLFKDQLEKGIKHLERLTALQQSYDELERCAQAKAKMEETMRRSLEMQLLQLLEARSKATAVSSATSDEASFLRKRLTDLEARLTASPTSTATSAAGGNAPAQLEELEARARQLEAALQAARSEAAGLRAELGPLQKRSEATEKRLAETQEQLLAAHQKHSAELLTVDRDYRARIDGYMGETESLSSKHTETQTELQNLRALHTALQDKLAAAEQELRQLRQQQDAAENVEQQQRLLRSEIAARDIELTATRRASAAISEQLDAVQRTVAAHEITIAGLRALETKNTTLEEQLRETKRGLQQRQQELATTQAKLEEEEEASRALQERIADAEGRVALSALQLKEQVIKLDLATSDRDTQRANCDRLQDSLSEAQDRIVNLHRELEAARATKGAEARGLASALDARATELAMLRADLEARMLQQQTSSRELLEAKQAVFVMQSTMTTTRLQTSELEARVAALTKQVEEHQAAENDQRTLVASQQQQLADMHVALHQAKQEAQAELATVQGKWQTLQAVYSAREAELAQLRQQLDAAENERAAMREKQTEGVTATTALRIEMATLKADNARLEREVADRVSLADHQQRLAEAAAALAAVQAQNESDRQASQRQIHDLETKVAELQGALAHMQSTADKKDEEIASLRSGNSEITDRHSMILTQRNEETLTLRRELDASQRSLAQQQAVAEQRERQIKVLEEAQTALRTLQRQHGALVQAHDQLVQSSEAQHSSLNQRITELTAQLAAAERARQESERQAETTAQAGQRAEADARVALASKAAEIEVLRQQQVDHAATEKALADARLRCDMLERQQATARDQHEREGGSLKDAIARAQTQAQDNAAQAAALRTALQDREAQLNKQQQTAAAEIEALRQELDKLRAAERQLEQQQLSTTQRSEAAAREAAATLERTRNEHEQRCSRLEATIAQQKEELRAAQQHASALKADVAIGNERSETLTRRLSESESEARTRTTSLQEQIKQLQARLEAANAKLDQTSSESDRNLRELAAERERVAQSSSKQQAATADLKRQLQESENNFATLRDEHQATVRLCQRADENASAAKAEVARLQELQTQLSEEHRKLLQTIESERDRLNDDVGRQRQALVELERKATEMVQTITGQRAQLATAECAIAEKTAAIAAMEQSILELEEKLIHEKTETYLVKLSEKDARIAALEMMDKKKHAAEITELQQARAVDLAALREQFNKRSELMAGRMNTTRESLNMSRELSTRDDILDRLQLLLDDHERLRKYIDNLVAEVLKQPEQLSMAILNGLPRMQHDAPAFNIDQAEELPEETLRAHIRTMDVGNKKLEMYVNQLLGRIVEHKPAILEVMNMG
eukprot:m.79958 g.79958  ORF g.79958 m.79958 type:complete len:1610 (+) comp13302_c1_seq3:284-5113(+)